MTKKRPKSRDPKLNPRSDEVSALVEAKRQKFRSDTTATQQSRASSWQRIAIVAAVAIFAVAIFLGASGQIGSSPAGSATIGGTATGFTPVTPGTDGIVRLPVATFDDGKARFYTYSAEGKQIAFFVMRSRDGIIRAAFDACDVCYPAKRGYHQEGDEMVCNNCGQRFPSTKINEIRGGCNPAPLDRTVDGSEVLIKASDIVTEGQRYF